MDKKISVIIPAFNEEQYIKGTIESLLKNEELFELVVVCDSCTDRTSEIAKNYTKAVFDVDFRNVSKVRNFGFSKSSGDIIVFLDADTIVSQNYLEEISKMSDFSDYGCAKCVGESKNLIGKYITWSSNNYHKKNIGGNFFVKKEFFNKVQGFNENMRMGEDTDIGERLRNIGAKYIFLTNCFVVPSERRYIKEGYFYYLLRSWFRALVYSLFRKYYNKKIASEFYE